MQAHKAATLALFACAMFVATTSLGCKKMKERMAEKAAEKVAESALSNKDAKVTIDNGQVTVVDSKGGDKMTVGAGAKVPDNWPSSVPIYPGAKVTASVSTTTSGKSDLVTFETDDSPDQVMAFYKSKLSSFQAKGDMNMGESKMLTVTEKSSGMEVLVLTSKTGAKTGVQITCTTKKK